MEDTEQAILDLQDEAQRAGLPKGVQFLVELTAADNFECARMVLDRAIMGEREFGGSEQHALKWDDGRFLAEIREELADAFVYSGLWQDGPLGVAAVSLSASIKVAAYAMAELGQSLSRAWDAAQAFHDAMQELRKDCPEIASEDLNS